MARSLNTKTSMNRRNRTIEWRNKEIYAEYIFQNQMQLFGHKFEEVAQNQIRMNENRSQVASLLLSLPEQFTKNELMALRVRNGQSSRVDMVLNRWQSSGFITKVDKNTYQKTPKALAR